ncbi:MAG: GDSL-type esterase/lipase family protein [Clostridiales bacterium]|jgi:lysophospholipase L1-like esterase|nr:GDSL-type esterase/lipase family protein [Clostridiales bacterium]
MKKAIKPILAVLAVIAIWAGLFVAAGLNLVPIAASMLESKYKTIGYEQGATVLMGSSSMQLWLDSESDLGPLRTVNVGVSGSVISQWMPWVDTLIAPFDPPDVLIYVGANDIHGLKKSASETMRELGALFDEIHLKAPGAVLHFITVYQTGAHPQSWDQDLELLRLVKEEAQNRPYLKIIDVASALLVNGEVDNSMFGGDLLHLSDKGYEIWTKTIREAMGLEGGASR